MGIVKKKIKPFFSKYSKYIKSSIFDQHNFLFRCIAALEELNELAIVPFMVKKQPDIVTTVRRLRKYIGPHSFNTWADNDAK